MKRQADPGWAATSQAWGPVSFWAGVATVAAAAITTRPPTPLTIVVGMAVTEVASKVALFAGAGAVAMDCIAYDCDGHRQGELFATGATLAFDAIAPVSPAAVFRNSSEPVIFVVPRGSMMDGNGTP